MFYVGVRIFGTHSGMDKGDKDVFTSDEEQAVTIPLVAYV